MKLLIQFCLFFIVASAIKAQSPADFLKHRDQTVKKDASHHSTKTLGLNEICNNGIDDDGDGLVDIEDPHCYFSSPAPDTCTPSKMVWASFNSRLYWINLDTHKDKVMDFPPSEYYGDITWAPNGKLYGIESYTRQIREIDPATAQTQLVATLPAAYNASNAMTADAQSNLYLGVRVTNAYETWHIVKYNISTGQTTFIANLAALGLICGGDITFLNGFLYVACDNSTLAKIDLATGNVQRITYTGAGTTMSFGLITLGDGYLYMCAADELFRLDPNTWVSTFYYKLPTYGYIFGMSSYSEFCEAPGCKAKIKLSIESSPPFCSNTGVLLKGSGSGINGSSSYTWTLPDNSTLTGNTITAFKPGKYFARYHMLPDTCGAVDSVTINIIPFPNVSLGNDTIVCPASTLLLQPGNIQGIQSYSWQDGTGSTNYLVSQPGLYWLDATNVCGTKRDSVIVSLGAAPAVNLGTDTVLCFETSITLKNFAIKQLYDTYLWSSGESANNLLISQPGTYWLQTQNSCGIKKDSIIISLKDSCDCRPLYAFANLGKDEEICIGDSLVLLNKMDKAGYRYRWQDGSTNQSYTVKQPGRYWVEVSTYCNTVRDTISIGLKGYCDCRVYIPTAFTPNNDNNNDFLKPLCYCDISGELFIYNRYGNLIYHTSSLQTGWDGNYQNIKQPNGAYTYNLTYKLRNKPAQFTQKGSFILVR